MRSIRSRTVIGRSQVSASGTIGEEHWNHGCFEGQFDQERVFGNTEREKYQSNRGMYVCTAVLLLLLTLLLEKGEKCLKRVPCGPFTAPSIKSLSSLSPPLLPSGRSSLQKQDLRLIAVA